MSITIEKASVNDIEMKYCRFGNGERNLIILPGLSVQSVMGAAEQIKYMYEPYLEDFTVYVFDRRLNVPEEYSVRDMTEDTVAVAGALGLKDLYIFGASQGGMIALETAIEHPELVKKVALGSASSRLKARKTEAIDEWIRLAEKGDAKSLYLSFGEKIYTPEVFSQCRDMLLAVAETVTDEELKRFIIIARGMNDFNITDQLQRIECPVLVTADFDDEVLDSDMAMEIAEKLDEGDNLELYMYHGFGHAVYDTAPDFLKRVMSFFLK